MYAARATRQAALDMLEVALDQLERVDDPRVGTHGLLAVLNSYMGATIVCRCTDSFPSVRDWRAHLDDA